MAGNKEGVFVAWNFSTGCFEYVAKLKNEEGKKVVLKPAHEIIGKLVLTEEQQKEYQRLYEGRAKKFIPPGGFIKKAA